MSWAELSSLCASILESRFMVCGKGKSSVAGWLCGLVCTRVCE